MNQSIKLLVVDDDPDVLFATSRIVKSAGYEVFEASTGAECLEAAKKIRPDLILLDVVLPDVNGPQLCKQIKSDPALKATFIVLISGSKTSSLEQADGLDEGADGYIARPISNRELKARVNAMVRILLAERERDDLIVQLKDAMAKVKQLSGFLPICSHCKKIRDDKGYWNQIEAYIGAHSEADFSHGICPDCAKKLYPEFDLYPETK
ncbi:MAG TPA: response regulator [Deltaproteobacteria bacterium]|nr:response regulator [Deltaproteobacteria bacterium]